VDNELLLVADKWPTDITISTWFFKDTTTLSANAAQGQGLSSSTPSVGVNVQIQPSTELLEDMDGTFIVHDSTVVGAEGCIMP
jgi:hypothetical protein